MISFLGILFRAGRATYTDKLFKFRNGRFEDLLSDELNVRRGVANRMAGRSVACVDRQVSTPILSTRWGSLRPLHISTSFSCSLSDSFQNISAAHRHCVALQGTGRYAVYVANYASGNIGPHALLEMDEAASDVTKGIIALSDVAATAKVNKFTGEVGEVKCNVLELAWWGAVFTAGLLCRWPRCCGWTDPQPGTVRCFLWQWGRSQLLVQEQWRWDFCWCGQKGRWDWNREEAQRIYSLLFKFILFAMLHLIKNILYKSEYSIIFCSSDSILTLTLCPPKGVEDQNQHGRGVALADFNGDGKTDIVYGNWNGPHRLYLQDSNSKFRVRKRKGKWWKKQRVRWNVKVWQMIIFW